MDKQYEMRLFSEIPHNLKNKIVDLNGKRVEITDRDLRLHSKIFIEISKNPGLTAYLIRPDETFFDFFRMKAKEAGTTPDELSKKLLEKFPE